MNNINVYVDVTENLKAPGIWIELIISSFVIFLVCGIITLILIIKNAKMLLPLSY